MRRIVFPASNVNLVLQLSLQATKVSEALLDERCNVGLEWASVTLGDVVRVLDEIVSAALGMPFARFFLDLKLLEIYTVDFGV